MAFTSGDYNNTNTDANGFWLVDTGYSSTQNASTNSSSFSDGLNLRHASSGMFSQWTLTRWLRVQYTVDGGATQTKYLIASTSNQQTMSSTTLSLGSGTVTIPHNSDGTQTITLTGYVDANTNATYVPVNTTASRTITLPSISVTPAPTQNSAPTISGSSSPAGEARSTLSFTSGTYTNATSVTTSLVASTVSGALAGGGGSVKSTSSPYTITDGDAADPAFYFATMDTVQGTGGPYYFYSSQVLSYPFVPSYTVSYTNSYGSNGTPASATVKSGQTTTFPSPGTRAGYTFNGWNNNANYYAGATTPAIISNTSYSADNAWTVLAPGFTDETVTSQLFINQTIQSTADSQISATNTSSYSIQYFGSGANPTSWLSINASTGQLSGSTNVTGTYTFRVAATGISTTAYSNTITITVVYPGKRTNSTLTQSRVETAKRWDGSQWVALTSMKRWDGSSWVNLSN